MLHCILSKPPLFSRLCVLKTSLPEQFIKGLTSASLQGRAQVVLDQYISAEGSGNLVFYLDGAHSPESMDVCGRWFSHLSKDDEQRGNYAEHLPSKSSTLSLEMGRGFHNSATRNCSNQVTGVNFCPSGLKEYDSSYFSC